MIPKDLDRLFRAAVDRWSQAIALATPVDIPDPEGPIAYIDLSNRATHVNFGRLAAMGVLDHVSCVLAHEVGHHIRYPHTLSEARRMTRFLREVSADVLYDEHGAPTRERHDWLLNLFFDLLINDELSTEFEASFVAIFRAMQGDWGLAFAFYVGVFEELWALPRCAILTEEQDRALVEVDPSWRARAGSCGEFLRAHPENRPLQLVRFLTAIRPFLLDDRKKGRDQGEAFEKGPWTGGPLDPDDVADAMRRRTDEEIARTWIREQGGPRAPITSFDPLHDALSRLGDLATPDVVALSLYRSSADKADLVIPASTEPGEPFVPGPHTSWDLGDDLDAVDWIGTIARTGQRPIPGVTTVARTFLPDDPRPGDREAPWVEIYVDSSGSMPNPVSTFSHQIEAGFVLVRAATRAGGRVRVLQYSAEGQRKVMKDFTRSSLPAEQALLQYIGGGTDFPWDELVDSCERFARVAKVRRVVISDSDFLANFAHPTPALDAKAAVERATALGGITGILAIGGGEEGLRAAGMEVLKIADWSQARDAARALSDALFRSRGTIKR